MEESFGPTPDLQVSVPLGCSLPGLDFAVQKLHLGGRAHHVVTQEGTPLTVWRGGGLSVTTLGRRPKYLATYKGAPTQEPAHWKRWNVVLPRFLVASFPAFLWLCSPGFGSLVLPAPSQPFPVCVFLWVAGSGLVSFFGCWAPTQEPVSAGIPFAVFS